MTDEELMAELTSGNFHMAESQEELHSSLSITVLGVENDFIH